MDGPDPISHLTSDHGTATTPYKTLAWLAALIFFLPLAACSDNFSSDRAKQDTTVPEDGERRVLRLVFQWPGDDFASREDLEIRSAIEALIVVKGVGAILRTGSGMGWMDIHLAVENPAKARRALEEIVAAAAPKMEYDIQSGVTHAE